MRILARSGLALLIAVGTVLLALVSAVSLVFTLAASTYVIRGTEYGVPFCLPFCHGNPTPEQLAMPYVDGTVSNPPDSIVVVDYPASFWPFSDGYFVDPTYDDAVGQGVQALPSPGQFQDLDGSVIFGYSQGTQVATIYKREFNEYWASDPTAAPDVTFVLLGNGSRPNGGLMSRFAGAYIPILDVSFIGPTPTTTAGAAPGEITTYDIARQYDLFADFPTNPLNLLAVANAFAGQLFVHPDYGSVDMSQAVFQGTYGDTAYYLIPTYPLPLLTPLTWIPVIGPIAVDMLDPILRVLVEAGYDRTINPGAPTPANFLYFPDPVTLGSSLLQSIPTGLTYGTQDILHLREPGTPPPGVAGQDAYGIGGPSVTLPNQTPPPAPPVQTVAAPSTPKVPSATPTTAVPVAVAPPAPVPVTGVVDDSVIPSTIPPAPQQNITREPIGGSSSNGAVKRSESTADDAPAGASTRSRPNSSDRPGGAADSNAKGSSSSTGNAQGKGGSNSSSTGD